MKILLMTEEAFYLVKYFEKPHDSVNDEKILDNYAAKIIEKLNVLPPINIKLIGFNVYDNSNSNVEF